MRDDALKRATDLARIALASIRRARAASPADRAGGAAAAGAAAAAQSRGPIAVPLRPAPRRHRP